MKLLLFLGFVSLSFGQTTNPIRIYNVDPTGSCPPRTIGLSSSSGNPFYCDPQTGNWSAFGGGSPGTGTVTSVSFTGGIVSVANPTTSVALTIAGTSGGIVYFSGTTTWASSAAGTAGHLILWGGAGSAPTDGGAPNVGTVTSVGFTGGLITVATATSTPAFTVAGTSGGIPYFSSASTWATSAAGTSGHLILWGGAGSAPTDGGAPATGTVTSVGFTGGLITVATSTTTPAFTVAGTSGGVPYFSSASTWASSAAGTVGHLMLWGGAGSAPTDGGAPGGGGSLTINTTTISGGGTNAILYGDGSKLQNAASVTRTGTGQFTFTQTALAVAPNDAIELVNTTAAATGAQQISPSMHWEGQGWKTTSTAASEAVDWIAYVLPIQGSSAPSSQLNFANSINGGAYSTGPFFDSNGGIHASSLSSSGTLAVTGSAINFQIGGTTKASLTSGGFSQVIAIQSGGGTKFTASGCSNSTTVGGPSAGQFTLGANTCNVTITMNGATGITASNGWSCRANDQTTAAGNTGLYFSSYNTTTATLTVPATAASSDVIDFHCEAF